MGGTALMLDSLALLWVMRTEADSQIRVTRTKSDS